MICGNIGLVHSCARRFRDRGMEYDDLFQAGCLGLTKAVDGFDASRGLQFSTYAVPVILGEIRRLFREGGAVKVSRSLKELSLQVSRAREKLSTTLSREPTVGEIAEMLSRTPEEIAEALQAGLPPLASLAAMYVGFCAAGVAGMVLAPVLLLLVKQLRDGGYIRLWR